MIALHILLGILKAIGILLLILLGLLLAVILAVLFCPVGYHARVRKDTHSYGGQVGISWLIHLISVKAGYESQGGEINYSVRILGIPVEKVVKFFSDRKENREKKAEGRPEVKTESKPEAEIKTEPGTAIPASEQSDKGGEKETDPETDTKTDAEKNTTPEKADVLSSSKQKKEKKKSFFQGLKEIFGKVTGFIRKILGIPGKMINALKNFRLTVQRICGKIKQVKEFLESSHFINAKMLVLKAIKSTFRHIRPRKVKGTLKFGTEDPFITGEILAAAGIFYPLYGEHFTIEPYFDQNILEGDLYVRGRIYGIFFAALAWKLFWNSDIRYIVKKFKQQ